MHDNLTLERWQWWRAEEPHEVLLRTVKDIILKTSGDRREELSALRSLYLDLPDPTAYAKHGISRNERSPYNLLQGAVDSTHAEITTQRPRPRVVTVGGNGSLQRKAKKLQRWIDGEYERLEVYDLLSQTCMDSLIFGTGLLKLGEHDGRNTLERVWVGDVWVDPREERFGCVRSLYQVYAIDRGVLASLYPDKEKVIGQIVEPAPKDDTIFPDLKAEGFQSPGLVLVIEGWRLPDSEKVPGRHVAVCEGGSLIDEEWKSKRFPFARMRWAKVPMRWFGQGMVERGAGIQCDLNETCGIVRDTFDKFVPKYVIQKSAGIDEDQINDEPGGIIYTDLPPGEAMQAWSPTISPIVMQHENSLAQRAYQVIGANQLRAGAQKPPDLESGTALQAYNDTTSSRFTPQGQEYETLAMNVAKLLIEGAETIAKRSEGAKQRVYGGKHALEPVDFDEADMSDEDSVYAIRVFPVSGLSNTFSARVDELRRAMAVRAEAGRPMAPEVVDELMDIPDLERFRDLETSGLELINDAIDRCLEGEDVSASSYWPKELATVRIAQAIQLAELTAEDPEGISKLRNLHAMVLDMGQPVEPIMPPDGMLPGPELAPPGAPPGGPAPLPLPASPALEV